VSFNLRPKKELIMRFISKIIFEWMIAVYTIAIFAAFSYLVLNIA